MNALAMPRMATESAVPAPESARDPKAIFAGRGELGPPEQYGPWQARVVTDTGRPIARPFEVGQRVYVRRRPGISHEGLDLPQGLYQLFRPGADAQRREVSQTQLDNATRALEDAVPVGTQARLSKEWALLVPKGAGFHPGTGVPRRWYGFDVALPLGNPDVAGPGWQGDSVRKVGAPPFYQFILEPALVVSPPNRPSEEELARIVQDWLEHEQLEWIIKAALTDRENPMLSDLDRSRRMEELEGPAHALTVMLHDGFYGPDGERRYLVEKDYATVIRLGHPEWVRKWEKTDL